MYLTVIINHNQLHVPRNHHISGTNEHLKISETRIDVYCVINEWLTSERRGPANETKVQLYGQTTTLLTKRFEAVSI